ncbi:SusC/RagA family TonB-linked outer membrane protein, partial [bacterium]|nr:SusC/RagA family TonB-linked outer membrane protein [bacterium]
MSGKVTDEAGEALPGANVLIQLTNLGASTDIDGNYSFTVPANFVRGQEVTMEARFIGYHTRTEKVVLSPGTMTQDFALGVDVLDMDAIIVTGVVEETPKTKLAFTVGRVSKEQLSQVPATSPEQALYGKVAGVKVVKGTGQPGDDATVQLRAPTSINAAGRSQEPLYIVDGVIIDPSITGSPLTDIPGEEIESIEVVKGAAGASLYGSRAANGVVRITTSRGNNLALNQTRIRIRNEFGYNQIAKTLDLKMHHNHKVNASGDFVDADGNVLDPRADGVRVLDIYSDAEHAVNGQIAFHDNPFTYVATGNVGDPLLRLTDVGGPFNAMEQYYDPGLFATNTFSVARNMENTNFLVSFTSFREAGVVAGIDGLKRYSVRANIDHKFRKNITIGVTGLYSSTSRDLIASTSGSLYSLTFMTPDAKLDLIDPSTGRVFVKTAPGQVEENPLYIIQHNDRDGWRRRVMGSFNSRWTPMKQFSLEGNLSFDRSDRNDERFWPIGFQNVENNSPRSDGAFDLVDRFDEALNGSVTAAFSEQLGDLTVRAKARGLFERATFRRNDIESEELGVQGIRTVGSANQTRSLVDSEVEQVRSEGYSLITGIDYKDRYIGDVLIRRDGSSLFGPDERWHTYFRASGAWRVSQEPWWFAPGIQEFKLRGSYGTAGGRPRFNARFETWNVSAGNVTKATLGNKELKPEFAKELEVGVDASFMNRFNLELTYARSTVEDQLLFVPLAKYNGFTDQWQNAGQLKTNTWEASLGTALIQNRDMTWTAGFTFDRTRQRITRLDVPNYRISEIFIKEDEVLGAFYGDLFIKHDLSQLPPGIPTSEFQVNDDGYIVWVGEGNSFQDGISKTLWGLSADLTDAHGVTHTYNWGIPIKFKEEVFNDDGSFKE